MELARQLCVTAFVLLCAAPSALLAQQRTAGRSNVARLLKALQATDSEVRAHAYEQLRADAETLARADVRHTLLNLLDRENRLMEATLRESDGHVGVSGKYGEEHTEYVNELSETVHMFEDWNDPRQACIFVRESYDPDSKFATRIAAHGTTMVPCLISMYKSDVWIMRGKAASVLVQAVAVTPELDAGMKVAARDVILTSLRDSRPSVRLDTVEALGRFGQPDVIAALQHVAQFDAYAGGPTKRFFVRESAIAAIASIEERAKSSAK